MKTKDKGIRHKAIKNKEYLNYFGNNQNNLANKLYS